MKFIASLTLFFCFISPKCLSQELIYLDKNDKVVMILDSYSKNSQLKVLGNIEDPHLRFLTALSDLLSLNSILRESVGVGTINIGFTGRNGMDYDSGLSPESIKDDIDRESYKKALSVNSENIETKKKLFEIRKNVILLMQTSIEKLEKKYQQVAISIIEKSTLY